MACDLAKSKIHEQRFVDMFNQQIKDKNISIPFDLILRDSSGYQSKTFKNIVRARVLTDQSLFSPQKKINTDETGEKVSKADIVLVDNRGVDVVFISHKSDKDRQGKNTGAGCHAQFMHAGTDKSFKSTAAYEELQVFKRKLLKLSKKLTETTYCFPTKADGTPLTTWDYIRGPDLVNIAIFGVNFGSPQFGRHNCNILINGDPKIRVDENNVVVLESNNKSILNGTPLPKEYFDTSNTNPKSKRIIFRTINAKSTSVRIKKDGKTYVIRGLNIWVIYRNQASSKSIQIDDLLNDRSLLSSTVCSLNTNDVNASKQAKKMSKAVFDSILKKEAAKRKKEGTTRKKITFVKQSSPPKQRSSPNKSSPPKQSSPPKKRSPPKKSSLTKPTDIRSYFKKA